MTGRRAFLGAAAGLVAAGCGRARSPPLPAGQMLSTDHRLGHRLRDGGFAGARDSRKAKVVIVGAGIAGLSAAWRLRRAGFSDFEILELEQVPGGNARWGENPVSAYPWGAHYIPLPTVEARATRLLLAELGVLTGDPEAAVPEYDERALVQAPQERLYRNGSWTEGLAPTQGEDDRGEWLRFQGRMRELRAARGRDGRRAFAIPLEHSSRDPEWLALDAITMEAWLRSQGFASERVRWLVNYACRDDYGCDYRQVSAWAGIHYFACRTGAARNADPETVLTWPEGNGFVVRELLRRYRLQVTGGVLVHRVQEEGGAVRLGVHDARDAREVEILAEHVIWAAPFGLAARTLADPQLAAAARSYDYAPWVTANLTLAEPPYAHHDAPLAWDNVLYDSPGLGYVVATHQGLASQPGATVVTWYLPLAGEAPAQARKRLLTSTREAWARAALGELARPHPEIREIARRIDVFANGHAMARPRPGLIWGAARRRFVEHRGRVHFAHADASGLSLFEEANDRGVAAAEAVLAALGARPETFRYRA